MGEGKEVGSGKGVIPYFFYDVISFIIPGSYLLFGGFSIWFGKQWSEALYNWMTTGGKQEGSIAAISVLAGVLFILFLGISSFVGFVLSTLSYQAVEVVWRRISPYTLIGLRMFAGSDGQEEKLKRSFSAMFGCDLEHCDLDKASNLCAYYIWDHSPVLGPLTTRFDAEKIMSQSSILVSFLLAVVDLAHYLCAASVCGAASPGVFLVSLFGFLFCMIASLFAFKFHRKKRVYGRYQIFLALIAEDSGFENPPREGQANATHSTVAPTTL
jgi:hypothetical protein